MELWNAWGCSTYISGSFCVSRTAAIGIPKFEAGPQKSVPSFCQHSFTFSFRISLVFANARSAKLGVLITYVLSKSSPTRGSSGFSH